MVLPGWLVRSGLRRTLAVGATALVLAVVAPWGSSAVPVAGRLAELLACTLAWEACLGVVLLAARRCYGAGRTAGPAILAACCLAASAPATAAMAGVFALAGDVTGPVPAFYGKSLLLGLVISFARRGLRPAPGLQGGPGPADERMADPSANGPDPVSRPAPCPTSAFLQRHASGMAGARLLALQAEDHYLRIHTDAGSALVLLRLRDAVAQLEGAGWQPHRSFWLAHGAPGRAVRRGQAWQVVLEGGLQVPVSKPAVPAMRDAGYAPAT